MHLNIVEEKDVSLSHLQKQKTCENDGSGAALHTWPAWKQLERGSEGILLSKMF